MNDVVKVDTLSSADVLTQGIADLCQACSLTQQETGCGFRRGKLWSWFSFLLRSVGAESNPAGIGKMAQHLKFPSYTEQHACSPQVARYWPLSRSMTVCLNRIGTTPSHFPKIESPASHLN